MMNRSPSGPQAAPPQRRWQPLGSIDRRVLGVLAEKAKTTPDIYPMSLNAVCTGCNQKSNRDPVLDLDRIHGRPIGRMESGDLVIAGSSGEIAGESGYATASRRIGCDKNVACTHGALLSHQPAESGKP